MHYKKKWNKHKRFCFYFNDLSKCYYFFFWRESTASHSLILSIYLFRFKIPCFPAKTQRNKKPAAICQCQKEFILAVVLVTKQKKSNKKQWTIAGHCRSIRCLPTTTKTSLARSLSLFRSFSDGIFRRFSMRSRARDNVAGTAGGAKGWGGGGREVTTHIYTHKETDGPRSLINPAPSFLTYCRRLIGRYHLLSLFAGSPNFLCCLLVGCVLCSERATQSVRRGEQVRWPDNADLTTWTTALRVLAVLPDRILR